ncbi:hypothetical protein Landi51_00429 [Colletotrichum acutatum]
MDTNLAAPNITTRKPGYPPRGFALRSGGGVLQGIGKRQASRKTPHPPVLSHYSQTAGHRNPGPGVIATRNMASEVPHRMVRRLIRGGRPQLKDWYKKEKKEPQVPKNIREVKAEAESETPQRPAALRGETVNGLLNCRQWFGGACDGAAVVSDVFR